MLDTMAVPVDPRGGTVAVDIYPTYLVAARAKESQLLKALRASQVSKPNRSAAQPRKITREIPEEKP